MKGAIFVLFLLSNNWNFFQKTSNITTNIYLSLCDQDSATPKSNSNLHHSIECDVVADVENNADLYAADQENTDLINEAYTEEAPLCFKSQDVFHQQPLSLD